MLRTLLLFLLCLLLPVPQGALAAASSGKTPVQAETSLPLNRTTFHFFSPEDIAANYKASKIIRVGYFDQHGVFEGEGEHLSGYAVALLTAISRYTGWEYKWVKIRFDELAQRLDDGTILRHQLHARAFPALQLFQTACRIREHLSACLQHERHALHGSGSLQRHAHRLFHRLPPV